MATIIPIKCFSCGFVTADKWEYFCKEVKRRKILQNSKLIQKVQYLTKNTSLLEKTVEGQVLDKLMITSVCCRKIYLCHVDID